MSYDFERYRYVNNSAMYMENVELSVLLISHSPQLQATLASSRVRKWGGTAVTKSVLEETT